MNAERCGTPRRCQPRIWDGGSNVVFTFAVFTRRKSVAAGKKSAEGKLVGEAAGFRNQRTGVVGVAQHGFGGSKAQIQEIPPGRDAEAAAELLLEGRVGAVADLCKLIKRNLLEFVKLNPLHDRLEFAEESDRRQQSLLRSRKLKNLLQQQLDKPTNPCYFYYASAPPLVFGV